MLSGHFLDNFPLPDGAVFDAGDFFDGQAEILRCYDGYDDIPAPWNGRIEAVDTDGDGLPDADPRWPVDEERLGTDRMSADTDGDGLGDLFEYCAGIYKGTDPIEPDTDGDGLDDGADPFPLSTFSGSIPHGAPPEGGLPGHLLSRDVAFRSSDAAPADVKVLASWDESGLYLGFDGEAPLQVFIHLDGSGRLGPFLSDALVKGGGTSARGDVYTGECSLHARFGDDVLYKGREVVAGARVASWQSGERWRLLVHVPAAAGGGWTRCRLTEGARPSEGLALEAGRVLGLNFTVKTLDTTKAGAGGSPAGQEEEQSGDWTAVYELHRFYDAVLEKNQSDSDS
jgi:hypothetical protein